MKTPIDLGHTIDEAACCGPLSPDVDTDKPLYPSFHVTRKESLNLPVRGKMEIEFCVTREENTRYEDGTERYSCSISVEKILEVEGEKDIRPSQRSTNTEDALDRLADEIKALRESDKKVHSLLDEKTSQTEDEDEDEDEVENED